MVMSQKEDYFYDVWTGETPFNKRTFINRKRYGEDTPRYLLAEGRFLENDYTSNLYTSIVQNTRCEHYLDNRYKVTCSAHSIQNATISAVDYPEYIDVIPGLLENWRNSKFNAGVTIGEGRESLALVGSTLLQLSRAVRDLSKGNLRGALTNLTHVPRGFRRRARNQLERRNLSGAWLELRYGWRPLLNDIYNLTEAIKLEGRQGIIRSSSKNEDLSYSYKGPYFIEATDKLVANEKRLHMKVVVSHAPSFLERWGLTDPATIAWELVPYSFVVDWFLPIGNYLQSLHAVSAMPVTSCVETEVSFQKRVGYAPAGAVYAIYYRNERNVSYYLDDFVMSRYCTTYLPPPFAILRQIPQSINSLWDLDMARTFDAAALLRQRFGGLRGVR